MNHLVFEGVLNKIPKYTKLNKTEANNHTTKTKRAYNYNIIHNRE